MKFTEGNIVTRSADNLRTPVREYEVGVYAGGPNGGIFNGMHFTVLTCYERQDEKHTMDISHPMGRTSSRCVVYMDDFELVSDGQQLLASAIELDEAQEFARLIEGLS